MNGADAISVMLLRSALEHLARDEIVEADADVTAALGRLLERDVVAEAEQIARAAHPSGGRHLRVVR